MEGPSGADVLNKACRSRRTTRELRLDFIIQYSRRNRKEATYNVSPQAFSRQNWLISLLTLVPPYLGPLEP
jgi:hypothetical protein